MSEKNNKALQSEENETPGLEGSTIEVRHGFQIHIDGEGYLSISQISPAWDVNFILHPNEVDDFVKALQHEKQNAEIYRAGLEIKELKLSGRLKPKENMPTVDAI